MYCAAGRDRAHFFWILLDGELEIYRHARRMGARPVAWSMCTQGHGFGRAAAAGEYAQSWRVCGRLRVCDLLQLDEAAVLEPDDASARRCGKASWETWRYRFQKLQSTTLQQEKMASLGTLAAGLMHELNNPGAAARAGGLAAARKPDADARADGEVLASRR